MNSKKYEQIKSFPAFLYSFPSLLPTLVSLHFTTTTTTFLFFSSFLTSLFLPFFLPSLTLGWLPLRWGGFPTLGWLALRAHQVCMCHFLQPCFSFFLLAFFLYSFSLPFYRTDFKSIGQRNYFPEFPSFCPPASLEILTGKICVVTFLSSKDIYAVAHTDGDIILLPILLPYREKFTQKCRPAPTLNLKKRLYICLPLQR
jgi:hypothetical protein